MQAVLSLGSNLGDKAENLRKAVELIAKFSDISKEGRVVETLPWGNENQENFLNQIIVIETDYQADMLLDKLLSIEIDMGRIRKEKWGPRIIDLDILFIENRVIESENLIVPHPFLHQREFILEPLLEIDPNIIHPKLKKTVRELYHILKETKEKK